MSLKGRSMFGNISDSFQTFLHRNLTKIRSAPHVIKKQERNVSALYML